MKKATMKNKNRLERIIAASIVAASLSLAISLFVYFRPFTFKEAAEWSQSLYQEAESRLSQIRNQVNILATSRQKAAAKPQSVPFGTPSSPVYQEHLPSSDEEIPFLTPSTDLGEISDLNTNTSDYSYFEDNIYMVMLDTALGPMLYYNQGDARWSSYLYGGTDPIGSYGCGPTAVAMVVNSFTPSTVTPVEIADWAAANGYLFPGRGTSPRLSSSLTATPGEIAAGAAANGYFVQGSGSSHSLIPDGLSAFGLSVESVPDRTPENVRNILKEGRLLVALMGRGSLTKVGHFIVITNYCDNGNVHIADPNSLPNSTVEWDLQQLMDELKGSYDSGGPLWSLGILKDSER